MAKRKIGEIGYNYDYDYNPVFEQHNRDLTENDITRLLEQDEDKFNALDKRFLERLQKDKRKNNNKRKLATTNKRSLKDGTKITPKGVVKPQNKPKVDDKVNKSKADSTPVKAQDKSKGSTSVKPQNGTSRNNTPKKDTTQVVTNNNNQNDRIYNGKDIPEVVVTGRRRNNQGSNWFSNLGKVLQAPTLSDEQKQNLVNFADRQYEWFNKREDTAREQIAKGYDTKENWAKVRAKELANVKRIANRAYKAAGYKTPNLIDYLEHRYKYNEPDYNTFADILAAANYGVDNPRRGDLYRKLTGTENIEGYTLPEVVVTPQSQGLNSANRQNLQNIMTLNKYAPIAPFQILSETPWLIPQELAMGFGNKLANDDYNRDILTPYFANLSRTLGMPFKYGGNLKRRRLESLGYYSD